MRVETVLGQTRTSAIMNIINSYAPSYIFPLRAVGPIDAEVLSTRNKTHVLQFALREGRNREVRKVCEHMNLFVNKLHRTSYGPFSLLEPVELKQGACFGPISLKEALPTLRAHGGDELYQGLKATRRRVRLPK